MTIKTHIQTSHEQYSVIFLLTLKKGRFPFIKKASSKRIFLFHKVQCCATMFIYFTELLLQSFINIVNIIYFYLSRL